MAIRGTWFISMEAIMTRPRLESVALWILLMLLLIVPLFAFD